MLAYFNMPYLLQVLPLSRKLKELKNRHYFCISVQLECTDKGYTA